MKHDADLKRFPVLCACWAAMITVAWPVLAAEEADKMLNVEAIMQKVEGQLIVSNEVGRPIAVQPSNSAVNLVSDQVPAEPAPVTAPAKTVHALPVAASNVVVTAVPASGYAASKSRKHLGPGDTAVSEERVAAPQDVASLRAALFQKEQELARATQEIERLKDIVRRIQAASRRELIVFHYNKAAVYRASLMYGKAEEEYLAALVLDPNDAAVHYNLAILYDDNFKDKKKAKVHYERFLELAPDDADAPKVREWLATIVL